MNLDHILYDAKKLEKEQEGSGMEFLRLVLSTDPIFVEYMELNDKANEKKQKLLEEEDKLYPILARVKRFPNALENYERLCEFLKLELPESIKAEAYRLICKYSKDAMEKYTYAKLASELIENKEYIYYYGLQAFMVGKYDEAFLAFIKSTPDSICRLATCYEKGLGVKKDLNKAFMLLDEECKKGNEKAIHKYQELCVLYSQDKELATKYLDYNLLKDEKEKIICLAKRQGYITNNDVHILLGENIDDSRMALAIPFINKYHIPYYEAIEEMEQGPLELLLYYNKNYKFDYYDLAINGISFMEGYRMNIEFIEFFLDGYHYDYEQGKVKYKHTASEAALFFDMPKIDAAIELEKLSFFIKEKELQDKLKAFIYEVVNRIEYNGLY